ncbi:hypothetical protein M2454_002843 [Aequitasia blattaphilus]
MRDIYDIGMLFSIYERVIDEDILKKAFEGTCKKRGTENLKMDSLKILDTIREDAHLQSLWKSYQKKYPYATGMDYEDIMESMGALLNKIQ